MHAHEVNQTSRVPSSHRSFLTHVVQAAFRMLAGFAGPCQENAEQESPSATIRQGNSVKLHLCQMII